MVSVLVVTDRSSSGRAASLRTWLGGCADVTVSQRVLDRAGELTSAVLDGVDVVVALVDLVALTGDGERALLGFVEAGGGLVLLGATLEAWSDASGLAQLAGKHGERQLRTEVVVDVAADQVSALARIPSPLVTVDDVCLDPALPDGAQVWLTTVWQFREQVLGWAVGGAGAGAACVVLGLGATAQTCELAGLGQLVWRAVRHAAGLVLDAPALGVAMVGYGAIGAEHGTAVDTVDGLSFVGVCDRDAARRGAAEFAFPGIRTWPSVDAVCADPQVAVAVVSVPPRMHAEVAVALLQAGKHVVVEKPFALTVAETDAMIAAAEAAGRTLTVYQNRRWDQDFRAVRDVVVSGAIGAPFHIETFVGAFVHPCRYWHSHEAIAGGVVYDWGSHYLDWVLQVVDEPIVGVSGARHKRVWHDVTNADMARVSLRFASGAEATFIHSDVAAATKPKWYVLGTAGAVTAEWQPRSGSTVAPSGEIHDFVLSVTDLQTTVSLHRPGAGGSDVTGVSLPSPLSAPFHTNLADHLLTGEALAVPAAEARRVIAVLEAAHASALDGGRTVDVEI